MGLGPVLDLGLSLDLGLGLVLDLGLGLGLVLDLSLGLVLDLGLVLVLDLSPGLGLVLVHSRELHLTEAAYVPLVHAILTNLTTQQIHQSVYNVHQRPLVISSTDQHLLPTAFTVC